MYILGISAFYHDSSVALIKDGNMVFAAEEERYTKKKHDHSFPINAIDNALKYENITLEDIEHIVFYEKPIVKFDRILDTHIRNYPFSYKLFYYAMPIWLKERLKLKYYIYDRLGKYPLFSNHHLSHASAAFYLSPFKKSAILTIDGVGEWNTLSIGKGNGNKVKIIKTVDFPHSIGLLYSTITAFLGFKVNNGEGKVMGLASYGEPVYKEKFKKLVTIFPDGSFKLNKKYFSYEYKDRMFSKKLIKLLGEPRISESELTKFHYDIAATLQWILEEMVLNIIKHAKEITGSDNLALSGGVVLNSVMNGKILNSGIFDNYFFLPASGDGGASMGGALYLWNHILEKPRGSELKDLYLGNKYSLSHIELILKNNKLEYKKVEDIPDYIANKLNENKIIGLFQGKMEFAPRALGNRSILANPIHADNKDILNERVKHRESFRPFAPSMLEEEFHNYFPVKKGITSPYMIICLEVKEGKRTFPAAIHVDNTARVQTVNEKQNKTYYKIIKKFYELTGVPVVLNTSFNLRGDPIVCSPQDAIDTFLKTQMDILVLENFIIEK
ncbi:carbamoyltransferase [bacterium]|nr:carbamoyltransferase [bacterium]